jgi:hypothetical protein
MATKKEFVAIPDHNVGLDRTVINHDGQIQLPQKPPQTSDNHGEYDGDDDKHRSIRTAISEKRHGAATKIRKTLHIHKGTDVEDDLAQQDSLLGNPVTEESSSRLKEMLPVPKTTMKDLVHNPVDTVKSKIHGQGNHEIAANIAAKEISHGQEVDLLNAHDAMQNAETDEKKEEATEIFNELMKERQNMYVRWTLDRHITKLRILPRDRFVRKSRAEFQTKDVNGNVLMDWRAYGQHVRKTLACTLVDHR